MSDFLAMSNNYYRVRYKAYKNALEEIGAISENPFVTKIVEDALKLEKQKSEDGPCDYCYSIEKATPASPRHDYIFCPMCGRARRKSYARPDPGDE